MPKPSSPYYRTTNWPDYNAALRRRGLFGCAAQPPIADIVKNGIGRSRRCCAYHYRRFPLCRS